MINYQLVGNLLDDLEREMRDLVLWQETPPEQQAFLSDQPFFLDLMQPEQWLQWVFIPKMRILLEHRAPLPEKMVLVPYFEEALSEPHPSLLSVLQALDSLFNKENA